MHKLRAVWDEIVNSLWFLPSLFTLGGGALAILLVNFNDRIVGDLERSDVWWLFGGSAGGARSVLESISGSIITVTGVIFSITIIALQLASTQFTPRVLRQFMGSRGNQVVLGVLIGTFTYTLLVQRTIRSEDAAEEFLPEIAVTVAVLLALTSIGFLIYFINHAARSVQAAVIIDSAAGDTRRALERIFSQVAERAAEVMPAADRVVVAPDQEPYRVLSRKPGYLQSFDRLALREEASRRRRLVRLEVEIGEYILPGQHIMSVWPAQSCDEAGADAFCDALVLGGERTPYQDVKHGIIELMDIAVKAMSPAINDPTTAVNSFQRMGEVLLDMAWREQGDDIERDDDGTPLVVLRRPGFDDTVNLAFDQVRHYATENPTVAVALLNVLGELAGLAPLSLRAPLLLQVRHVLRQAELDIEHEHDMERVRRAAERALEQGAKPEPERRPYR
jgi:uncharacterized membrane protein